MTIHHATIKRAASLGFILTEVDRDGSTYAQCHWTELNRRFLALDPKEAVAAAELCKTLRTEYPAIDLKQSDDLLQYIVVTSEGEVVWEDDFLPNLAEIQEACEEAGVDMEGEEPEEAEPTIVVADFYKEQYKERGNPNHCGDWLAGALDGRFRVMTTEGEVFDVDKFTATLALNGVELTGKWADLPNSGQKGWVGRYRMNGRQRLEVRVAITGKLMLSDTDYLDVPAEALEQLRKKHAKAIEKHEAAAKKNGNTEAE